MEISVYWKDWRGMAAVKFLRLEDFLDNERHGMALHLEPQGILFAEVYSVFTFSEFASIKALHFNKICCRSCNVITGNLQQSENRAQTKASTAENIPEQRFFARFMFSIFETINSCILIWLFSGKSFLRAKQMNINIATWGRLMKRVIPPCNTPSTFSPQDGAQMRSRPMSQNVDRITSPNDTPSKR